MVDGTNATLLLDVVDDDVDFDRPGKAALPREDFPTLREPIGLTMWFLEDSGGLLWSDRAELGLVIEKRAVDAPRRDGEEDNAAVEARCSSLPGAVSDKEARDQDVVPGPYRFRDGDATVLPRLVGCGVVLFFFFFPSVKSGFLL